MNNQAFDLRYYGAALRRRRGLFVGTTAALFLVSAAFALFLPSYFRSEAVILIEQQEIPAELVRSTVTSFADQRIEVISQRVMTSAHLGEIIQRYGLYEKERARDSREAIVERMRGDIYRNMVNADVVDPRSGRPVAATIAFRLAYENRSPELAQKVTNELVTLYLNENIKTRTESAAETTNFLGDEAERLGNRVSELEARLAAFKDDHGQTRPEFEELTRDLLDRTELALTEVDRREHSALQQKIHLEGELAQVEPYQQSNAAGGSPLDQLQLLETELSAAEARYSATHPDVVRLRRQTDAARALVDPAAARAIYSTRLATAREQLAASMERYGVDHPEVAHLSRQVAGLEGRLSALPAEGEANQQPTNPVYLTFNARLKAVDAELASYAETRAELQRKYRELSENLAQMPAAEQRFRAITREYENTLAKYREVTAKQMEARLSQNLEAERKGERFTLIEPPLMPQEPAKPNRLAILLIGMILAFGAGVGMVIVAESVDDRIYGRAAVQALLTEPPLASIPVVAGGENDSNPTRKLPLWVPIAGLFGLALLLVHWFIKPIDVLWFIGLRALGF